MLILLVLVSVLLVVAALVGWTVDVNRLRKQLEKERTRHKVYVRMIQQLGRARRAS